MRDNKPSTFANNDDLRAGWRTPLHKLRPMLPLVSMAKVNSLASSRYRGYPVGWAMPPVAADRQWTLLPLTSTVNGRA